MSKPVNEGQMRGEGSPEGFGAPRNVISPGPKGVATGGENLGEKTGFVTSGYIDKNGQSYGEAAKLNQMPPGMDIGNQESAQIHDMPMKRLVAGSFPGDGWNG